jgi:prophage maintenance system killer protein
VVFVDLNGGSWDPDSPDVDEAEAAMLAVAAHEVDEAWLADWLRQRVCRGELKASPTVKITSGGGGAGQARPVP